MADKIRARYDKSVYCLVYCFFISQLIVGDSDWLTRFELLGYIVRYMVFYKCIQLPHSDWLTRAAWGLGYPHAANHVSYRLPRYQLREKIGFGQNN